MTTVTPETAGRSPRPARFDQLRLEGVTRRFGAADALADLDLTISAGEFVALLGPSGCGKSTALNCVAGLLPLTGGSIWADDVRIDTLPPEKRGFGMVFQSYALFPHLSVRANIAFGLRMRKLPRDAVRSRTEAAIRLVRLEDHADKLPGQLSGGQQQRVAIARAVVLEPSLVLMDEPLSNLDAKLRLQMRTEIRRLHQSLGLTTVYVTHDQEEALSLADRLVVLREGRVQQVGTPEELHTRPANWHVADFMGFRNLLELEVTHASGDHAAVRGEGLTLLGTAGVSFIMGIPGSDDVMLNYQSTSFHDALYVREVLGLRRAPEFEAWLQRQGITQAGGRLLPAPAAHPLLAHLSRTLGHDGA